VNQLKRQNTIYITGTLAFLVLPIVLSSFHAKEKSLLNSPFFYKEMLDSILLVGFFYLNYLVLIPKLYFTRNFVVYAALCLASLLVLAFIPPTIFPIPIFKEQEHSATFFFFEHLRHAFFPFVAVLLFSMTLKISHRWRITEEEKLNTQLSYLKGQINPHFLFNTLNSIYYLSIEKSEKTPDAIIRLSNMMRFVISEANDDYVSLTKEISYVTNFIELQKLRLGNTATLYYKIAGTTVEKKIAPLILIPFIENAFKHGVNPEENSSITINIEINDRDLHLRVENKKVKKNKFQVKSGLGVPNARKRLDLLYPRKHELTITDSPTDYVVNLIIDLL
jgi:LytS/YehU family sensor histidine kinase